MSVAAGGNTVKGFNILLRQHTILLLALNKKQTPKKMGEKK